MGRNPWIVVFSAVIAASIILIGSSEVAYGDGTPLYRFEKGGKDSDYYLSTYESRQLALVSVLNDSHQKIELFLSIFSLEPGKNLSVIVPFREKPENVELRESTDEDFLNEIGFYDIKQNSRIQDMKVVRKQMKDRSKKTLVDSSLLFLSSPFGTMLNYIGREYHRVDNIDGPIEEKNTGGTDSTSYEKGNVKEIRRYNFKTGSVRIYSISANATMEEFLEEIADLAGVPSITREVFEEYRNHYIAILNSVTEPPVSWEDWNFLNNMIPNTMQMLLNEMKENKYISYQELKTITTFFSQRGFQEIVDRGEDLKDYFYNNISSNTYLSYYEWIARYYDEDYYWNSRYYEDEMPFHLRFTLEDLLFSFYGYSDYKGNVLSVVTHLDNGTVYFPLGTSKGWSNPIKRTTIVLGCDRNRSLSINTPPDSEAFLEDGHYYVLESFDSNPDSDIEANLTDLDEKIYNDAMKAKKLHESTPLITFLVGIIVQSSITLFSLFIFILISRMKKISPNIMKFIGFVLLSYLISSFVVIGIFMWDHRKRRPNGMMANYSIPLLVMMIVNLIVLLIGVIA